MTPPLQLPMTQFYWVAVHGNSKQKPGNFDTCGSNRTIEANPCWVIVASIGPEYTKTEDLGRE